MSRLPPELDLRLTNEASSTAEVRRCMAVHGAVLESFGWHAVPVQNGFHRWVAFNRQNEGAIADAHRDTGLIAIRREGESPVFSLNIPSLLVVACQFAQEGFGCIPDGEVLAVLLAWLLVDACGLPMSDELITALAIQNARIAAEYFPQ
ncbi:hypothetical protein PCO31110_02903 [Pandoraea communis]|uniref:Uncharacterized protein n=1 Tax=Pandoraea communis TaxID=2508297 RepID=A0A5E4VTV7_9BURK|nr:hypothetical protein [Pandoraea communis]VVE15661.1 hypothetical protein PCO31110_02903 [Pandoraea communis]